MSISLLCPFTYTVGIETNIYKQYTYSVSELIDKKRTPDNSEVDRSSSSSRFVTIPISIFADRSVASLEAIVEYLKDSSNLTYHEIASMLNRDDRTIWTCYSRAKAKRKMMVQDSAEQAHHNKNRREHG